MQKHAIFRVNKKPLLLHARGIFTAGGEYWIRTSDFYRVKVALSR